MHYRAHRFPCISLLKSSSVAVARGGVRGGFLMNYFRVVRARQSVRPCTSGGLEGEDRPSEPSVRVQEKGGEVRCSPQFREFFIHTTDVIRTKTRIHINFNRVARHPCLFYRPTDPPSRLQTPSLLPSGVAFCVGR